MGLIQEFKAFAMRGNVVDMAVGVVIGTAFGKIISVLVGKVIMPVVGVLTGGIDFSTYDVTLQPASEGKEAVMLGVGSFATEVINFTIIAFAIFMTVKLLNAAKARFEKAQEAAPPPEPSEDILLLREIRDSLKRA